MLGGADKSNGDLGTYITGADTVSGGTVLKGFKSLRQPPATHWRHEYR